MAVRFRTKDGDKIEAVAEKITFNRRTKVTSHPVQKGEAVSDHAQKQQGSIKVKIHVSNTPIHVPGREIHELDIDSAEEFFERVQEERIEFVSDRKGLYPDVVVSTWSFDENKTSSTIFSVSLAEIEVAQFERVQIAPEEPRDPGGSDEQDKGKQRKKERKLEQQGNDEKPDDPEDTDKDKDNASYLYSWTH